MKRKRCRNTPAHVERIPLDQPPATHAPYMLTPYIWGTTRGSTGIESVEAVCESHLSGRYGLQTVNTRRRHDLAQAAQVLAVSTVVSQRLLPQKKLIGNVTDRVVVALDLEAAT